MTAKAIEARRVETRMWLDPTDESAVPVGIRPKHGRVEAAINAGRVK